MFRILGQAVGTGALAKLYAPAANRQAVTSTLVLVNVGTSDALVRVTVAPGGADDSPAQTLITDQPLGPGDRIAFTEGWALAPGDAVRVNAPAIVAATLFGSESAA